MLFIKITKVCVGFVCFWERETENMLLLGHVCVCICCVHGFHTNSFFILHLLHLRDCGWVSNAFRVYVSLISTRQLPSNDNTDPGVNPQLQACNQTHLFILPRGPWCHAGVQVDLELFSPLLSGSLCAKWIFKFYCERKLFKRHFIFLSNEQYPKE